MKLANLIALLAVILPFSVAAADKAAPQMDPVLKAMVAELERSKDLRLASVDAPYFVQYAIDDGRSFAVKATLGALITTNDTRFRVPRIQVRVGDYAFDNTNYVYTDYFIRTSGQTPLDNRILALRSFLWLATDRVFKGAVAGIARKRAALRNVNNREKLPDFDRAEPVVMIREPVKWTVDEAFWRRRTRLLSALFTDYQIITDSQLDFETVAADSYLANTEGTLLRTPDSLVYLRVRAQAQAPDGMPLHNAVVLQRRDITQFPSDSELRNAVREVADQLKALAEAPVGEPYVGPVLFEDQAAPQLFAQLLGGCLILPRRPVAEPGRPNPFRASELEGHVGSKILPEWMDVVDDPTQTEWRGQPLFGRYEVDMEGVVPEPLQLVANGVLKGFLLTRQPVGEYRKSNGRARLPGRFGAMRAHVSNLFVSASERVTAAALRQQMLELCKRRNKPYGIIIRKLDFPSSASLNRLRRFAEGAGEHGAGERLFSEPILAYRLYADGREELVRGLRFRAISVRRLRDIMGASEEDHLFRFMGSAAPLSLMGVGGYIAPSTVVAPSVLVDDLELDPIEEEFPKLPVVPPPKLVVSR